MKKISILILFVCAALIMMTGCTAKKNSTINYQGRFKKYMSSQSQVNRTPASIDLSEGPKTNYEGRLGPSDVNFEFKIQDPY